MPIHKVLAAALAFGTPIVAGEPAAALLPPQSAPVQRASDGDVIPLDPVPDAPKIRPRPADFKFPPPYSKRGKDVSLAGMWDRIAGNEADAVDEEKLPPAPLQKTQVAVNVAHGHKATPQAAVPQVVASPSSPIAPMAIPRMAVAGPAWRWFGYGAPVPGRNPYAPDGVYAPVNPGYYFQTGATPGAIPAPLMPMHPTLQAPTTAEPPALMSRPEPADPNITAVSANDGAPSATLEPPIPFWKPTTGDAMPPLSSRSAGPVYRGHAPDETDGDVLLTSLRRASTGYATRIDLTPRGHRQISLKLTLAPGARADALAERISKLPELSGYEVEMEFAR